MPKLTETEDWVSALRTFVRDTLGNKNWQIRKGETQRAVKFLKNLKALTDV
tara:strand:+ start:107 stop:259 length:153 start_codon:yes stop_codon:yes gene_type:complete